MLSQAAYVGTLIFLTSCVVIAEIFVVIFVVAFITALGSHLNDKRKSRKRKKLLRKQEGNFKKR